MNSETRKKLELSYSDLQTVSARNRICHAKSKGIRGACVKLAFKLVLVDLENIFIGNMVNSYKTAHACGNM